MRFAVVPLLLLAADCEIILTGTNIGSDGLTQKNGSGSSSSQNVIKPKNVQDSEGYIIIPESQQQLISIAGDDAVPLITEDQILNVKLETTPDAEKNKPQNEDKGKP